MSENYGLQPQQSQSQVKKKDKVLYYIIFMILLGLASMQIGTQYIAHTLFYQEGLHFYTSS